MNGIFCCVFNQEKYVDMFFLLLKSILTYGNLDCNTNILVYTSTPFKMVHDILLHTFLNVINHSSYIYIRLTFVK